MRKSSFLVVAALHEEITSFAAVVASDDRFNLCVTGPGRVPAAARLTRAVSYYRPELVVALGTAGRLDLSIAPGVYEVGSAVAYGVSELPGLELLDRSRRLVMGTTLYFSTGPSVATGDEFVSSASRAYAIFKSTGAPLVDMETHSYAYVCAEWGVPLRVFKAVSDDASAGSEVAWRDSVASCSEQLSRVVLETMGW